MVEAVPPKSSVTILPSVKTVINDSSSFLASSISPRYSSIITAESTIAEGFAIPLPAINGAEPVSYTHLMSCSRIEYERNYEVCLVLWIIKIFILLLSSIKTVGNPKKMTVSVIIPAYNEEKTVAKVVRVVKSLNYIKEVIVVNDGSSDQTSQNALDAGAMVINHRCV